MILYVQRELYILQLLICLTISVWYILFSFVFQKNAVSLRCIYEIISLRYMQKGMEENRMKMYKVSITAVRQTVYYDLMAQYENPIEHTCDVRQGQQWISIDGKRPDSLCLSAWESMRPFVEALAKGEGNFFDGWMKNPMSAMISCNDGFRPFSFYIEVTE